MDHTHRGPSPRAKASRRPRSQEKEQPGQVAHTLTACSRCRQRKTRCDASLPRCGPCERSQAVCEYFDAARGRNIPRSYVVHLQNRVQQLERELTDLTEEQSTEPDLESVIRSAGLIKLRETEEAKYLGSSSGIAMTRLVMDLAKHNQNGSSIRDVVSDSQAKDIKARFDQESSKPSSKIYPLTSSVAAPNLPTRELVDKLVNTFNSKAQYMFPILHEPSFAQVVNNVYGGSTDAYENFTLRLVIAISMQKLQYAGLADSFYLAALPYFEDAIRPMNMSTLQCFLLVAVYSIVTPTRTASYWVVGLAAKLCEDLGLIDDRLRAHSQEAQLNPLELDMRRRLLWLTISCECGLAHSLGRPSAFGVSHDHFNMPPFELVDDVYITASGTAANAPSSMKKRIAWHFVKMRLLQLEIRRTLYLKKRPTPITDEDPWFQQMEAKLNDWLSACPNNDEGTGLNLDWFKGRCNTMVVFLFRPSPQVPSPSIRAARLCFEASTFNIRLQRKQVDAGSIDVSWIFTQSLFMALNTVLWALSYDDIRREHPREQVEQDLQSAQETIYVASKRWPGVESALELYQTLSHACLKAYDDDVAPCSSASSAGTADRGFSPSNTNASLHTISPSYSPETPNATLHDPQAALQFTEAQYSQTAMEFKYPFSKGDGYSPDLNRLGLDASQQAHEPLAAYNHRGMSLQHAVFDPLSFENPLPGPMEQHSNHQLPLSPPPPDAFGMNLYMASIGDQYLNYLQTQALPDTLFQSLNPQQQSELMATLESNLRNDGIPSPRHLG